MEECGPCSVFASFTLAFALHLRKNHGKTLSQGTKNLSQIKKNLSQSTVYILPKHPHIMCRLSWNLEASNSWNPQGLSNPVMGLLDLYLLKSLLLISGLTYFCVVTLNNPASRFNIFLTVLLRIILVGNQLDAQLLLWYIYLNPLHVSRNYVLIVRTTLRVPSWPAYRTATNREWLYQKLYSYNCPPEDEHIVVRNM